MFLKILMDSFKKISIDSFEDFPVDQDRTVSEFPDLRIDSFRFFWTYIHPCLRWMLVVVALLLWLVAEAAVALLFQFLPQVRLFSC